MASFKVHVRTLPLEQQTEHLELKGIKEEIAWLKEQVTKLELAYADSTLTEQPRRTIDPSQEGLVWDVDGETDSVIDWLDDIPCFSPKPHPAPQSPTYPRYRPSLGITTQTIQAKIPSLISDSDSVYSQDDFGMNDPQRPLGDSARRLMQEVVECPAAYLELQDVLKITPQMQAIGQELHQSKGSSRSSPEVATSDDEDDLQDCLNVVEQNQRTPRDKARFPTEHINSLAACLIC